MTEKHISPAIAEYAARELWGRRERDGLVEELVGAVRDYAGFVDLEIPSVYVCPTCAPAFPDAFDAAKLRLLAALEALADYEDEANRASTRLLTAAEVLADPKDEIKGDADV